MSEPVSALGGRTWDEGLVEIREIGPQGMITLRGDLAATPLKNAATGVAAVDFPGRNEANCVGERGLCWMSPDELLILCPYDSVAANLKKITCTLGSAHALAVDVSDARAVFQVTGAQTRDVLSKLAPVDLAPAMCPPGQFRRTRFAQVPAAFWFRSEQTCEIICFRSVAQYMFDLLTRAAQTGSAVAYH